MGIFDRSADATDAPSVDTAAPTAAPEAPVTTEATVAPAEPAPQPEPTPAPTAPAGSDPRQAAWDAFIERAEAQAKENGTIDIFMAQKARGEFDKIPPTFVG